MVGKYQVPLYHAIEPGLQLAAENGRTYCHPKENFDIQFKRYSKGEPVTNIFLILGGPGISSEMASSLVESYSEWLGSNFTISVTDHRGTGQSGMYRTC
jgi:hypothetical protein